MPSIASSVNSTDPRNSWCPVTIPSSHQRSSFGVVTVLSLVGPKATCCGPNASSGPGTWWFGVVRLPLRRFPSPVAMVAMVAEVRAESQGVEENRIWPRFWGCHRCAGTAWEPQRCGKSRMSMFSIFCAYVPAKFVFFCNTFSETESSKELLRFQKVQMALMALSTCRQCCCVGRISELHRVGLCRSSGWDLTSAWDAAVTTSAVIEWLNCNCPHTIRNSG